MARAKKEAPRGDLPGDVVIVGDIVRFSWAVRSLRGTVRHVGELIVTVETKSGRTYEVALASISEIEASGP